MASTEIRSYLSIITEHVLTSPTDRWRILTTDTAFLATVAENFQTADTNADPVQWLSTAETLKHLQTDFLIATQISELVANDRLTIRTSTTESLDLPTLLLNSETVVLLVPVGDTEAVETVITDEAVVSRLWDIYETEWETGVPESVDTPPYSRLLSLAETTLGDAFRADLDTAYTSIEERPPADRPEPVTVGLLVGAKHELLLRDVVEWAETSTLATQGTVSKLKQQLEESGAVRTESENIGVGRPRQRLILDDRFTDQTVEELVVRVYDEISRL